MHHGRMMSTKEWLVPRPLGFAGGEVDVVFNDDPGAGDTREEEADLVSSGACGPAAMNTPRRPAPEASTKPGDPPSGAAVCRRRSECICRASSETERRPPRGSASRRPGGFRTSTGKRHEKMRQTACKPGSVEDGHSSRARVTPRLVRPARTEAETPSACRQATPSLFGLAPGGVYRAVSVAGDAVRTYRTVSPLPARRCAGGLFSAALSLESPPPGVTRHRVSVEPGLSSPGEAPGAAIRPSGSGIQGDRPARVKAAGPGEGSRSRRTRRWPLERDLTVRLFLTFSLI